MAIAVIALLVAFGGRLLLEALGRDKPVGVLLGVGAVVVAVRALRTAYDPRSPEARAEVTKYGAYLCAALLALAAILAPASWVFGSCIFAAEAALVFDLITVAARKRAAGGK